MKQDKSVCCLCRYDNESAGRCKSYSPRNRCPWSQNGLNCQQKGSQCVDFFPMKCDQLLSQDRQCRDDNSMKVPTTTEYSDPKLSKFLKGCKKVNLKIAEHSDSDLCGRFTDGVAACLRCSGKACKKLDALHMGCLTFRDPTARERHMKNLLKELPSGVEVKLTANQEVSLPDYPDGCESYLTYTLRDKEITMKADDCHPGKHCGDYSREPSICFDKKAKKETTQVCCGARHSAILDILGTWKIGKSCRR